MEIIAATTEQQIQLCEKVIIELRPHLAGKNIWEIYQNQMKEKFQIIYILEQNQAVSFIGYRIQNMLFSGKTLYIDDLCTLSSRRSKGYAGILLNKVFEMAKNENCNVVSLDSGHHRHTAHKLYLKYGFVISSHHFQKTLNTD